MVKTKKAFTISVISALIIGLVHYIAHHFFNNPVIISYNITMVGIVTIISVFLVSFIGMKWRDWR